MSGCFTGQGKKGHVLLWDGTRESIFNIGESYFSEIFKISTRVGIIFMVRKSNFELKKMKPLNVGLKKLNHKSGKVRNTSTYKVRMGQRGTEICV